MMENPLLLPGDQITVHFKQMNETSESFNAKGEVLSKRLTKQRIEHDSQLYYAVKFDALQPQGQKDIKDYVQKQTKMVTGK